MTHGVPANKVIICRVLIVRRDLLFFIFLVLILTSCNTEPDIIVSSGNPTINKNITTNEIFGKFKIHSGAETNFYTVNGGVKWDINLTDVPIVKGKKRITLTFENRLKFVNPFMYHDSAGNFYEFNRIFNHNYYNDTDGLQDNQTDRYTLRQIDDYTLELAAEPSLDFIDPVYGSVEALNFTGYFYFTGSANITGFSRRWNESGFNSQNTTLQWTNTNPWRYMESHYSNNISIGIITILDEDSDVELLVVNTSDGKIESHTQIENNCGTNSINCMDVLFYNNTNDAIIVFQTTTGSRPSNNISYRNYTYGDGLSGEVSIPFTQPDNGIGVLTRQNIKQRPGDSGEISISWVDDGGSDSAGFMIFDGASSIFNWSTNISIKITTGNGNKQEFSWVHDGSGGIFVFGNASSDTSLAYYYVFYNRTSNSVSDIHSFTPTSITSQIDDVRVCPIRGRNDAVGTILQTQGNDCGVAILSANGSQEAGEPTSDLSCERDTGEINVNIFCYQEESSDGDLVFGFVDGDDLGIETVTYDPDTKTWSTSYLETATSSSDYSTDDIETIKLNPCIEGDCFMLSSVDAVSNIFSGVYWNGTNIVTTRATLMTPSSKFTGRWDFAFLFNGTPATASSPVSPTTQTPDPTLTNTSQNNESIYFTVTGTSGANYSYYNFSTFVLNTTSNPFNLTGLNSSTQYCVNVTVYNSSYDIPLSNFSNTICTYTYPNVQETDPPIISNLLCTPNNESLRFNWTTDEGANYTIDINQGISDATNTSFGTSHWTNVTNNIVNNTAYSYNITACDSLANCNTTANYACTTLNNTVVAATNSRPSVDSITVTGDSNNDTNTDFVISYTASDADSDQLYNFTWYNSVELDKEMVGGYSFDVNSSTLYDVTGNGNNGTVSNAVYTAADCNVGGCYYFDGSGDTIDTVDNPYDILNNLTLAVWVKPTDYGTTQHIVSKYDGGTDVPFQIAIVTSTGVLRHFSKKSGSSTTQDSTDALTWGAWNHVAVWRNSTHVTFYINGVQDSGGYQTYTVAGKNSVTMNIGSYGNGGQNYFQGYMDDLRIYNYSLSSEQIWLLSQNDSLTLNASETNTYDNWTANVVSSDLTDYSAKLNKSFNIGETAVSVDRDSIICQSNDLNNDSDSDWTCNFNLTQSLTETVYNYTVFTKNNDFVAGYSFDVNSTYNATNLASGSYIANSSVYAPLWNNTWNSSYSNTKCHSGGCYSFDNSRYFTVLNGNSLTEALNTHNQYSVGLWVFPTEIGTNPRIIISSTDENGAGDINTVFELFLDADGILRYMPQGITTIYSGYELSAQTWYHIVLVRDGTSGYVYVDGILRNSSENLSTTSLNPESFKIGSPDDENTDRHFYGLIDDIVIYNRSLSAPEVWALSQNQTILNASETSDLDTWQFSVYPSNLTTYSDTLSKSFSVIATGTTQTPTPSITVNSYNNESIYLSVNSYGENYSYYNYSVFVFNTTSNPYNWTGLNSSTQYCINATVYNSSYDVPTSNFSDTVCVQTSDNAIESSTTTSNIAINNITVVGDSNNNTYTNWTYNFNISGANDTFYNLSWGESDGAEKKAVFVNRFFFNNTNDLVDRVNGTGTSLTWNNSADSGKGAFIFDGTSSRIDYDFGIDSSEFTIFMRVMPYECGLENILVTAYNTGDSDEVMRIYYSSGDTNVQIQNDYGVGYPDQSACTNGTWVNIAVVYSESSSIAGLYVNGIRYDADTSFTSSNPDMNHLRFGMRAGGQSPFYGELASLELYGYAFSDRQVSLKQNGTQELDYGITDYGETWVVTVYSTDLSTESFENSSEFNTGISPATLDTVEIVPDNYSNTTATNWTLNWTGSLDTRSAVTNITYFREEDIFRRITLEPYLIYHFNLNESRDVSYYDIGANLSGPVFWNSSAGYDGFGAFSFNDVSASINFTDEQSIDVTTGNWSFEFWVLRYSNSSGSTILGHTGYTNRNWIYIASDGRVILEGTTNNDNCNAYLSDAHVNEWLHIGITVQEGTCQMYENGVAMAMTDSVIGSDVIWDIIGTVQISSTERLIGELDDVRIYKGLLQAGQYLNDYNGNYNVLSYNQTRPGNYYVGVVTSIDNNSGIIHPIAAKGYVERDAYDSDSLSMADGSSVLFIDKHNPSCSDSYTRSQALSGSTPWCMPTTANLGKISSGDTVLILEGEYMTEGNNLDFSTLRFSQETTISGYPGDEVHIGGYYDRYLVYPNNLWTILDSSINKWTTTLPDAPDSSGACVVSYDGGADTSHPRWMFSSYTSSAYLATISQNNMEGIYCVNSNLQIRLGNVALPGENGQLTVPAIPVRNYTDPIDAPVFVTSNDNSLFKIVNSTHVTIENLTILFSNSPVIVNQNSSNVTVKNLNITGTRNSAIQILNDIRNISIHDNFVDRRNPHWWAWDRVKGGETYDEDNAMDVKNTYFPYADIYNNDFGYSFNGIMVQTGDWAGGPLDGNQYVWVHNNTIHDILDDGLEIETHAQNQWYYENCVYNVYQATSTSPIAYGYNVSIYNNVFNSQYAIFEKATNDYEEGATWKINTNQRVPTLQNVNISHNTNLGDGIDAVDARYDTQANTTWYNNLWYTNLSTVLIKKTGNYFENITYDYNLYYVANPTGLVWTNNYGNDTNLSGHYNLSDAWADTGNPGGWDLHSIYGQDPMFANPDTFDVYCNYSLAYTSPAIDRGIDDDIGTGRNSDYYRNPIYGIPDIGAIEYQPPYTVLTYGMNSSTGIRIYDDGRFRYLNATNNSAGIVANLSITRTNVQGSWVNTERRNHTVDLNITSYNQSYVRIIVNLTKEESYDYVFHNLNTSTVYNISIDGVFNTTMTSDVAGIGTKTIPYLGTGSNIVIELVQNSTGGDSCTTNNWDCSEFCTVSGFDADNEIIEITGTGKIIIDGDVTNCVSDGPRLKVIGDCELVYTGGINFC